MADLFGRGGWILILIIIIVFGSKKLPDAARSLGKSIRIFKSELDAKDDGSGKGSGESSASDDTSK